MLGLFLNRTTHGCHQRAFLRFRLTHRVILPVRLKAPSALSLQQFRGRQTGENRFKDYEDAVLLFAELPHVPFTNNRAERDLRMSKVKQKVSGCFRTRQYAEAYCRISSYLQTMAHRGYNPLVAIQMALSGQIYAQGRE